MSESSPKNSWQRAGMATIAGLGLLVVITLVLVASTEDLEKERSRRAEIDRIEARARLLSDEGERLSKQLEEISEAVGWRSPSVGGEAGQSPERMLRRVRGAARVSFEEQDSPAWKELNALTDDELIAEVRSLRDDIERRRRAGRDAADPGLAERLAMASSILDSRGLRR